MSLGMQTLLSDFLVIIKGRTVLLHSVALLKNIGYYFKFRLFSVTGRF